MFIRDMEFPQFPKSDICVFSLRRTPPKHDLPLPGSIIHPQADGGSEMLSDNDTGVGQGKRM